MILKINCLAVKPLMRLDRQITNPKTDDANSGFRDCRVWHGGEMFEECVPRSRGNNLCFY